jgi:uncharacterized protein YuzE
MKVSYDPETDALYVRFAKAPVCESDEVRPGVVLDYDPDGRIVALEILDASRHLASAANLQPHSTAPQSKPPSRRRREPA